MCQATHDNILGVLSLIFWTMTIIVSLKYVLLVLRADNNGEGGLIAMLALATMAVKDRPQLRRALMTVGLFGTAVFFGDGVITPAISVLSAVEGLEVVGASAAQRGDPDHPGGADAAVRGAALRHRRHRQGLRADHAGLVRHADRAGPAARRRQPRRAAGAEPDVCLRLLRRAAAGGLHRPGRGGAGASRAARRCMPTWATSASCRSASPGTGWSCRRW